MKRHTQLPARYCPDGSFRSGEGDCRRAAPEADIRTETPFALCADDYAISPGVSRGIVEALDCGAVSATSVMTNMPHWPDSAGALRRFAGQADIGLHLNLTLGNPLGPMPTFAPDGKLPSIGTLLRLARGGRFPSDEIAEEIERQADRFVEVFGRAPDHVDGHQHAHVVARVRPLLLACLRRRGWAPWLRDSADTPWRILRRGRAIGKALAVAGLAHGLATEARADGLRTNNGFAGYSRFDEGESVALAFGHYLTAPGPQHLVMCHPGYVDDALRRLDPVLGAREQELAHLLSPAYRRQLEARSAVLKRMTALA